MHLTPTDRFSSGLQIHNGVKNGVKAQIYDKKTVVLNEIYSIKWRREGDSNPRYGYPYTRFPGEPFQPLRHLSEGRALYRLSVTVSTYRRVKKSSGSKSGALGRSAAGRPR